MPEPAPAESPPSRPVLYQLCRAGERFEVGDGPCDLEPLTQVLLGRGEPNRTRAAQGQVLVDDPWMSSRHASLTRRPSGGWRVEDLGSTNGVLVNGSAVQSGTLVDGDLLETGRTFWLFQLEPVALAVPTEPFELGAWTTWSPGLARKLARLKNAGGSGHALLRGPGGTGKGFLARTLHQQSGRTGRLVHLDCRERRPSRLVVDLFGGPPERARLAEANGGSLFLENLDALPLELQDRLARALRRGSFQPGEGKRRVPSDVRLIASTGERPRADSDGLARTLVELVGELDIRLPDLASRRPDMGLLLDDFLARAKAAPAIGRDACRAVLLHRFEGQTKALARVIEAAAALAEKVDEEGARSGSVELQHLPAQVIGREGLAALRLDRGAYERPPSIVDMSLDESLDGEATEGEPERGAPDTADGPDAGATEAPLEDDDDIFTNTPNRPLETDMNEVSAEFLAKLRSIENLVEGYDRADSTDPSMAKAHTPPRRQDPPEEPPEPPASRPTGRDPRRGPPPARRTRRGDPAERGRPPSALNELEGIERSYANAVDPDLIVDALARARGNVSAAARYLGKPRALVLKWMREFGIDAKDHR